MLRDWDPYSNGVFCVNLVARAWRQTLRLRHSLWFSPWALSSQAHEAESGAAASEGKPLRVLVEGRWWGHQGCEDTAPTTPPLTSVHSWFSPAPSSGLGLILPPPCLPRSELPQGAREETPRALGLWFGRGGPCRPGQGLPSPRARGPSAFPHSLPGSYCRPGVISCPWALIPVTLKGARELCSQLGGVKPEFLPFQNVLPGLKISLSPESKLISYLESEARYLLPKWMSFLGSGFRWSPGQGRGPGRREREGKPLTLDCYPPTVTQSAKQITDPWQFRRTNYMCFNYVCFNIWTFKCKCFPWIFQNIWHSPLSL